MFYKSLPLPVCYQQVTFHTILLSLLNNSCFRYDDLSAIPARLSNDNYIYRMLNPTSTYTTYYTEPVKKFIGTCIRFFCRLENCSFWMLSCLAANAHVKIVMPVAILTSDNYNDG